jgi:hypothetical protein
MWRNMQNTSYPMPSTKHFCPCGMCGIGLGTFKHRGRGEKWEKIEGETKLKWRGGEITRLIFQEYGSKGNYWYRWEVITKKPKYVCPECFEKYNSSQLA